MTSSLLILSINFTIFKWHYCLREKNSLFIFFCKCGLSDFFFDSDILKEKRNGSNVVSQCSHIEFSIVLPTFHLILVIYLSLKFLGGTSLASGPVVKTPCSQRRGHGFNPWLGN